MREIAGAELEQIFEASEAESSYQLRLDLADMESFGARSNLQTRSVGVNFPWVGLVLTFFAVKIKGTINELAECARWFRTHPHLAPYVRHVEIWIPVWGPRAIKQVSRPLSRRTNDENAILANAAVAVLQATMAWEDSYANSMVNYKYHFASQNATLEEIFLHIHNVFPAARILTLEGGHCKKPPLIGHFRSDPAGQNSCQRLPVLPDIHTFVMRGAWNIMRTDQHWQNLSLALPGVREWHCQYAKPKVEGYQTIAGILRRLPPTLVHINVNLEGYYSKESLHARWLKDGINPPHLCRLLGAVAPRLESLAFTGKVCSCLFDPAKSSATSPSPKSKLKSLDLVVKTCCRDKQLHPVLPFLDNFSGISNLNFIRAFEKLVISAIYGLKNHQELDYMRIRFIDIDSACPPLNPYFHIVDSQCMGLWNQYILEALHESRPDAHFVKLTDGISPQYGYSNQIVGAIYPRTRPLSIHTSTYKIIADAPKH